MLDLLWPDVPEEFARGAEALLKRMAYLMGGASSQYAPLLHMLLEVLDRVSPEEFGCLARRMEKAPHKSIKTFQKVLIRWAGETPRPVAPLLALLPPMEIIEPRLASMIGNQLLENSTPKPKNKGPSPRQRL